MEKGIHFKVSNYWFLSRNKKKTNSSNDIISRLDIEYIYTVMI